MLSKKVQHKGPKGKDDFLDVANRNYIEPVPKYKMPDNSMPARVAYEIVKSELSLDGNPILNLASFVTTEMEEEARQLMLDSLNKNYVDQDEYPRTTEIQNRCVNILADLFHADQGVGTATIGSSEAIHLAGLALKWQWRKRRLKAGLSDSKPNIVMGRNVQVCWEKFARYFEVEPRYVPLTDKRFIIDVNEAMKLVDENTIGVVGILGSTLSGEFEPVAELNKALEKLNKKTGWEVPIHVDAASGGFVAPFVYPKLKWDFRLSLVQSINVSGHKYGLVYPGIGWVIWRDKSALPEELIFHVNYLGSDEPTFNLNFSKGSNNIIAQYYNFLRLGKEGYTQILKNLLVIAKYLAKEISKIEEFELISQINALPVICFKLKEKQSFSVFDISNKLRERGWIVPAYTMAPEAEDVAVMRIVIREGFNRDLADLLINDINETVEYYKTGTIKSTTKSRQARSRVKVC